MVDAVTLYPKGKTATATKLINKTVDIYIRANISLEIYPSYSRSRRRAMPRLLPFLERLDADWRRDSKLVLIESYVLHSPVYLP